MEANNITTPPASDSDTSPSLDDSHDSLPKQSLSTAKESNSQNLPIRWNTCPECDFKKKKRCPHHKLIAKRIKPGVACYKCNLSKKRCEGVPCVRCRSTGQQYKAQTSSRKIGTSDQRENICTTKVDGNDFSIYRASPTTSQVALGKSTKIPSLSSLVTTDERIQEPNSTNGTSNSTNDTPNSTNDRPKLNISATLTSASTFNLIISKGPTQPAHWHSTNGYDVNQLLTNNSELLTHGQALELEMQQLRVRNEELENVNKKMRNREDELIRQVTEMNQLRVRNEELEDVNKMMRNHEELIRRTTEMAKQLTDLMYLSKQQ
ncbi:hypothetical protein BC937DRAFT_92933 [Endogone sp. FLAS-F59071]|nr:hypothetical protein BC937DRAFT_92933 [Endogone sp. FLAS-F59071]|eukprot:RUS15077.1 hypothetical protein BC937DRAFT_92933 [Endogone sp. FLAS-F59071]